MDDCRFEYRFTSAPWQPERHDWSLISERGAVSIWAELDGDGWKSCIEVHHATRPSHIDERPIPACWLLHAPCWHDRSTFDAGILPEPSGGPMNVNARIYPLLRSRFGQWLG